MMGLLPDRLERNPDGSPKGYPCCDRVFPDPDPMMRFIDRDEGPSIFWDLPPDERSRRARIFLLVRASGEDDMMSWVVALDFAPETIRDVHEIIDVINRDDARLERLIARGAHPGDRLIRLSLDG
ncbi:hypothetical protein BH23CHL8_BH23CHL8_27370 [soil metagenome]